MNRISVEELLKSDKGRFVGTVWIPGVDENTDRETIRRIADKLEQHGNISHQMFMEVLKELYGARCRTGGEKAK